MSDIGLFGSNRYILFNKNREVATLECERSANNKPHFSFVAQHDSFLPYGFKQDDVDSFINSRKAPSNREHIKEILDRCGCNDLEGLVRFSYGTTLNDTFWIKPIDKDITWDEVSLYRNKFDENIARIAFDGGLMGEKISSASPEIATDGTFAKCWKRYGDNIYLIKRGSYLLGHELGKEVFSERMAYDLARNICQEPVEYELIRYRGRNATRCPLFTSEDISFVPIVRILGYDADFEDCLLYFESLGDGEKFKEMMVLDALTLNTDRHLKNFGVLYNSDTGEIKGLAPVFDNNLSLLPYASEDELRDLENYLPTRSCAFEEGFNELAIKCTTSKIRSKLISLKDFKFEYCEGLEESRTDLLNNVIHYQIDNVLNERTLSFYRPTQEMPVSIDSCMISISYSLLPEDVQEAIKNDKYSILPFEISFKDGVQATVENCVTSANVIEDMLYIEIDSASISGVSRFESLEIEGVNNLVLQTDNVDDYIEVKADKIEFQLSRGNTVSFSDLYDVALSVQTPSINVEHDNAPDPADGDYDI